jgi:hypothetical protein
MLNAVAFRLGKMIARGWVDEKTVADALLGACDANKYLREHGHRATMKTIESGIEAGKKEPFPDLPDRDPPCGDGAADSDLSDLSDLSGVGAAKQRTSGEQQARGRKAETGTWEEPDWTLLDDRRGELPDFPAEALPASMLGWLVRAAHGAARHSLEPHWDSAPRARVPLLVRAPDHVGGCRRLFRDRQDTRHGRYEAGPVVNRTRAQIEDRRAAA